MSTAEHAPPPDGATHAPARHHLLAVLVENKAGVLARVAGLFARRGFNILSLAVAPTADERISQITLEVDVASAPLDQVMKQLDKLVNVLEIHELAPGEFDGFQDRLRAFLESDA
ncbi:MAG: acetolactate synthase small subunit [Acidimicrobiales bacterium]|nr:acetolactate synthase small subunit [Acidimicrobiales bacterium]